MIDVVAVPEGFEDGIAKAEDDEVLDGVFSQIVVDAEELVLVGSGVDRGVEQLGGFEVCSEGFFDYQSSNAVRFVQHSGVAECGDCAFVEGGGQREIVEPVIRVRIWNALDL